MTQVYSEQGSSHEVRTIALVTVTSPVDGGGGANLRSLLSQLNSLDIRWLYLASYEVKVPNSYRLGPLFHETSAWRDLVSKIRTWVLNDHPQLQKYIQQICAEPVDMFWVVGHNEGLFIATEVARRSGRPVHLTIHDDVPQGIFGRSRRYRFLKFFAGRVLRQALSAVRSVDVTSSGMQQYYQRLYGTRSEVVHLYIPPTPDANEAVHLRQKDNDKLICGHVGSIYAVGEFREFCLAFARVARTRDRQPRLVLIGCDKNTLAALSEFSEMIETHSTMPEPDAVRRLVECDLVYAMYPFSADCEVFRKTSFPTKLSTYVQSKRPIFAHTPTDSTLADAVDRFQVGKVCSARFGMTIDSDLETLLATPVDRDAFERMRKKCYGMHNIERMRRLLSASA